MLLGKLDVHVQKNEVRPLPHTIHKTNSKRIIDLNVSSKTTKLLAGNICINLYGLGLDKAFLDVTPKAKNKEKIDTMDDVKM